MNPMTPEVVNAHRTPEHPVDQIFLNRWSPRAMSGEGISEAELMVLFEAARWAPSSYNAQPWRFVYARRETEHWSRLFGLLVESNQAWCKNAAALVVVCSRDAFEHNGKPNTTHSYCTGAAWASLALQGSLRGLVVHGMIGFDREKARLELGVPEGYTVEAMAAIGRPAPRETLPEALRAREVPSTRKPLRELVFEGVFKG